MSDCIHHWIIAPADGGDSLGVCKLCGADKMFVNSTPEHDFDNIRSKDDVPPRLKAAIIAQLIGDANMASKESYDHTSKH